MMTDNGLRDDFQALLEMARDKTAAGRAALASAVGDLFSDGNEVLTDRERALMTDILRRLVRDMERPVRRQLSEALADTEKAPRELVAGLADDDVDVAYPILLRSHLLRDVDLIESVRHRTLEHQLALAMRRGVGEDLAGAFGETGEDDVIKALLESANLRVSKATREYLVDQSKRVDAYQNPRLMVADIDPALAKRMYWWVAAAVREYVLERWDVHSGWLDSAVQRTVRDIAARELDPARAEPPSRMLAERLAEASLISPQLMVKALRQGEVPLFEALLARQSGLRLTLLRRIIFEVGGQALAVVCKSIPTPEDDFAAIFRLTRKAGAGDTEVDAAELERVLALYNRIRPESASAIVGRWGSDPDYLNALRILSDPDLGAGPGNGGRPAGSGGQPAEAGGHAEERE